MDFEKFKKVTARGDKKKNLPRACSEAKLILTRLHLTQMRLSPRKLIKKKHRRNRKKERFLNSSENIVAVTRCKPAAGGRVQVLLYTYTQMKQSGDTGISPRYRSRKNSYCTLILEGGSSAPQQRHTDRSTEFRLRSQPTLLLAGEAIQRERASKREREPAA